ncbi:MAG: histidine triad nucleotide-binding protein [Candidatus Kerfeldbacteria bacterium]|nr:histidine triad nucleotide-binding protein [Candidatus Kerfeldbacteria bacterium]
MDCLFCDIAKKRQASDMVFEDSELVAIRDINPKARVHLLIVPKRHLPSLAAATADDSQLLGRLLYRATLLAEQEGVDQSGYKVVINTGRHGGQVVDHLHIHLLGGEPVRQLV